MNKLFCVLAIAGTCLANDFPVFSNFKEYIETNCETIANFGFIEEWYGSYEITKIGCDSDDKPHGTIKIKNYSLDYEEFVVYKKHGKTEKVIRKFPNGARQSVVVYKNGFPDNYTEYYSNGKLKSICVAYNFDTHQFEYCNDFRPTDITR